jgi:hypothetical protein
MSITSFLFCVPDVLWHLIVREYMDKLSADWGHLDAAVCHHATRPALLALWRDDSVALEWLVIDVFSYERILSAKEEARLQWLFRRGFHLTALCTKSMPMLYRESCRHLKHLTLVETFLLPMINCGPFPALTSLHLSGTERYLSSVKLAALSQLPYQQLRVLKHISFGVIHHSVVCMDWARSELRRVSFCDTHGHEIPIPVAYWQSHTHLQYVQIDMNGIILDSMRDIFKHVPTLQQCSIGSYWSCYRDGPDSDEFILWNPDNTNTYKNNTICHAGMKITTVYLLGTIRDDMMHDVLRGWPTIRRFIRESYPCQVPSTLGWSQELISSEIKGWHWTENGHGTYSTKKRRGKLYAMTIR